MVRRRSASPPPMRSNLPARPPPAALAHPPPTQPKQPGLMGQMAATAGGVAVGHVIGSAVTGAFSGSGSQPEQVQSSEPARVSSQQNPCQYQIDELIRCTQTQRDITLCTGFSDALKECSRTYGVYPGQM
ncbi:CHCH domain protein [Opisthorchis viverrini]|uniref:CHCH domain protein n=2 Tax=Opisthorchis viverrini TaxID=6198 RepID=A0A1S8WLD0_OPIVI|nr:hypothetical protein T265_08649 [Opisthorchis viverrini]KER23487.1 hypothetical protein T265_08649 [Opisthorchis viverrini]OON15153.1 CHCH domain protein [Opisthorchis viverrini]